MDRMITPEELPGLVAGEVLLDSTRLDWENLQLRKFHSEPQELQGPMICDYTIVLYSDPAHQVCRRTDGSWKTYWVERGWVSVLTRAQTSQWRWDSHVTGTHAYLPYAALAPVAAEVFERDVEDIELHDIAAVQDLVLTEMVERLSNEASAGGLGGRLYVEALRTQICIHLLRNYATVTFREHLPRGGLSRNQTRLLAQYIEEHLDRNLSLAELAKLVQLSPYHFSQRFRAEFGCPPYAYVIRRRLEHAKRLLRRGDVPLKVVAARCGFADQCHMTRLFRRAYNVTPGQYRREVSDACHT
jgi:AraC family transcriptional regulator